MAASGDPEGGVLDGLELLDGGLWGIGEPDWGSVCEERPDEGLEGQHQCLLLLAPVCTGEGLDYFGFFFGSGGYGLDVAMEVEVGVERDPQDFRGTLEGERGAVEGDVGIEAGLMGIGGEKGDVRFGG